MMKRFLLLTAIAFNTIMYSCSDDENNLETIENKNLLPSKITKLFKLLFF